jgi:hypothetical protein
VGYRISSVNSLKFSKIENICSKFRIFDEVIDKTMGNYSLSLKFFLLLFIYSHVHTLLVGSFLPPVPLPHTFPLPHSIPGRPFSASITNFVEEKRQV